MPNSVTALDKIVDDHFAAEAELDIDGVVAGFTPAFQHEVIGDPRGVITSREGLRQRYEELLDPLKDAEVRTIRRYYGCGFVVDESEITATVDGVVFGFRGQGQRINVRLLHVFEIQNGKISREQGWADFTAIAEQLGSQGNGNEPRGDRPDHAGSGWWSGDSGGFSVP
jgi:uncharacterized protein